MTEFYFAGDAPLPLYGFTFGYKTYLIIKKFDMIEKWKDKGPEVHKN